MTAKTERITILGSPDFKAFLLREAEKEGVSLSQLVRQRCENRTQSPDEELLVSLIQEVRKATQKAKKSLEKGLTDAERTLAQLRANR